jgi:hypothetical protein
MIESSLRHQAGEITDEEYEEVETAFLEHLNTIRALNSEAYYDYPEQYHEEEG